MKATDAIRSYLGWCPMAAAANRKECENEAPQQQERESGAGGPAATRRALLFSRLSWAAVGLAWVVALAALPYLPEVIPVHWNMYGEPDGFAGRFIGAFGLPVIITVTAVIFFLIPRYTKRMESFEDSRDIWQIVIFATIVLLLGIETSTLASSAGAGVPVPAVFPVLLGAFFIVLGGLMPYIRRNTMMGIRLPWTIRSEEVWKRTHVHGGPVFVAAGVLIALAGITAGAWAMPLAFAVILGTILYITLWSYRLSRRTAAAPLPAGDN